MNELSVLLNAIRSGDPTAGAIVVSLYGRPLIGYLNLIAPNLSDVDREILAEQTIETALSSIDKFDDELASFDAWVRGFARRKLFEHYRNNPVTVGAESSDAREWVAAAKAETVDDMERRTAVADALQTLQTTDQLIISLRDINGLSYADISNQLGVSVAACRQRHRRAVTSLRDVLEKQLEAQGVAPSPDTNASGTAAPVEREEPPK